MIPLGIRFIRPLIVLLFLSVASTRDGTAQQVQAQNAVRPEPVLQTGHTGNKWAELISPDGRWLATGGDERAVIIWNAVTGKQVRTLRVPMGGVRVLKLSPDGRLLAAAGTGETKEQAVVVLFEVGSWRSVRQLTGAPYWVEQIDFSADGRMLRIVGRGSSKNYFWNVTTGSALDGSGVRGIEALELAVQAFKERRFDDDGWTKSRGSWVNGKTGEQRRVSTEGSLKGVHDLALSPDGRWLAFADDASLHVWNGATGHLLKRIWLEGARSVAFSPDGRWLALGMAEKTLILATADWTVKHSLDVGKGDSAKFLAFSPDSRLLASAASKGVKLWDFAAGGERTLGFSTDVAFSPDGRLVATVTSIAIGRGEVVLWDVESGAQLRRWPSDHGTFAVIAFAPDGRLLATAGWDLGAKKIKLWEASSGRLVRELTGHKDNVEALAFSPDGRWLASAGWDTSIKLWEVATGSQAQELAGHSGWITALQFTPRSGLLASASVDGSVRLWNPSTGRLVAVIAAIWSDIPRLEFWARESVTQLGIAERTLQRLEAAQEMLRNTESQLENRKTELEKVDILLKRGRSTQQARDQADSALKAAQAVQEKAAKELELRQRHYRGLSVPQATAEFHLARERLGRAMAGLDWVVVTPEGLFDGTPAGVQKLVAWRFARDDTAPPEVFYSDFYHPGLLAEVLAGRRPKLSRDFTQLDRRQPKVGLSLTDLAVADKPVTSRTMAIRIEVAEAPPDPEHPAGGGARDVRLFRNGSLVKVWRGDILQGQAKAILDTTVSIVGGENRFTAYAFNSDNIKSSDAALMVTGADSLRRKGTAYIVAIGINEYANPGYNLKYAVADAQAFAEELRRQQTKLNTFASVEIVSLLDRHATKANLLAALGRLAGNAKPLPPGAASALAKLKPAEPEDAVFVYYAGHGTAAGPRFYLIPHDLGYKGSVAKQDEAGLKTMLEHSVSDRELEQAFEGIGAGHLLLVIDACNSGQALEAEEKRRGPMNSIGLAQLAYEKGMYVLAAAQGYQAALEAVQYGHGLLTYALVEEGLKTLAADVTPKDGLVVMREWLDFTTLRVPQLQTAMMREGRSRGREIVFMDGEEKIQNLEQRTLQRPRVFYRRELEALPLIVAKPEEKPR